MINEGIKFTKAELAKLDTSKFSIGIEYEFETNLAYLDKKHKISDFESVIHDVNTTLTKWEPASSETVKDVISGNSPEIILKLTCDGLFYYNSKYGFMDSMTYIPDTEKPTIHSILSFNNKKLSEYLHSVITAAKELYQTNSISEVNLNAVLYAESAFSVSYDFQNLPKEVLTELGIHQSIVPFICRSPNFPIDDHYSQLKYIGKSFNYKSVDKIVNIMNNTSILTPEILQHLRVSYAPVPVRVTSALEQSGIKYTSVHEDSNQCEVVSPTMSYDAALVHIENMMRFIRENGSTGKYSGLHISISHKEKDKVDLLKFLVLLNTGHILKDFPPRSNVSNINDTIVEELSTILYEHHNDYSLDSMNAVLSFIVDELKESDVFVQKYQSIKFGDYELMDGRIELRYFGGVGYENRLDEVLQHLHKALYVLSVASGESHEKEYKKGLYKLLLELLQTIDIDLAKVVYYSNQLKSNKKSLDGIANELSGAEYNLLSLQLSSR